MPDPKNEYERLRRERAGLDEQILALVHRRAEMSKKIGAFRHRLKETAASESLREILGALAQSPAGPMSVEASQAVFREIVSACQHIEEQLRVAFVGPEGSDGHQASRKAFGHSAVAVAADSVAAVFDEVERGRAAVGIVPVELSTEGVISTTLDRLVESALKINGEVELPIAHHLMNRTGNPKDVEKIYAHATVLARCRRYIEKHFPNTPVIDVRSTAQAAKFAADDHGAACIATDLALELYGLEIAQSSLDDEPDSKIRFLFVGPTDSPPPGAIKPRSSSPSRTTRVPCTSRSSPSPTAR